MNTQKKLLGLVTNGVDIGLIRKFSRPFEQEWSIEINKALDLEAFISKYNFPSGVILYFAGASKDIKALAEYMNTVNIEKIRIIVVSKVTNKKLEKAVYEIGCSNLYAFNTVARYIVNSVEELYTNLANSDRAIIRERAPLKLNCDPWILEHSEHIKKSRGSWNISLIGPTHNMGEWIECPESGREGFWEYIPNDPIHPVLQGEQGSWLFKGQKPIIVGSLWKFKGKEPHLLFLKDGIVELDKFKPGVRSTILSIARNSESSKDKVDEIAYEFLKEFQGKKKSASDYKGRVSSIFERKLIENLKNKKPSRPNVEQSTFHADAPITDFVETSKHFIIVNDPIEKKKYMENLTKDSENIIVWTKNQEHILEANAKKSTDGNYQIEFLDEVEGDQLKSDLESKKLDRVFVRGNLDEASIFFSVDSPTFNLKEIKVLIPNLMWKVQRRKSSRLKLDGRRKVVADITLFGEHRVYNIEAPIKNISSGGLALLIDDIHYPLFKSGKMLKEVRFDLEDRNFFISGVVKWTGKLKKKDRLRQYSHVLGLEFKYLAQKDMDFIQRYVLEELFRTSK